MDNVRHYGNGPTTAIAALVTIGFIANNLTAVIWCMATAIILAVMYRR